MIEIKVLTVRKFDRDEDYEDFKNQIKSEYPEDFFTKLETDGQVALKVSEESVDSVTAWSYKKGMGLVSVDGENL